jgi:hypothetical protein
MTDDTENKRDPEIQRIFENADDSIMGILGNLLFIIKMRKNVNLDSVKDSLPSYTEESAKEILCKYLSLKKMAISQLSEEQINWNLNYIINESSFLPCTIDWNRDYRRDQLVNDLKTNFLNISVRMSFIFIGSVFEFALGKFISRLDFKGFPQKDSKGKRINENIKSYIKWAYSMAIQMSDYPQGVRRLPFTFTYVDMARRLRNSVIHSKGKVTTRYNDDAIKFKEEVDPKFQMDFNEIAFTKYPMFKSSFEKFYNITPPTTISLLVDDLIAFSQSCEEILIILHGSIQKNFFKSTAGYDYGDEGKTIKFDEILK